MGLQRFEQRLERLVEGAFARAFRSGLQPVEIARRLTREMDLHRSVGVHGVIAPNAFEVSLSPKEMRGFQSYSDVLEKELVSAAREHARSEGYSLVGPVEVRVRMDRSLSPSTFAVSAEMREGANGAPAALLLPDGRRVEVSGDAVTIGRLPDCGVVLGDPNVSRRHAELRRHADAVVVVDLGSTNGTRVNGVKTDERRLADGDEITLGTTTLRFEAS